MKSITLFFILFSAVACNTLAQQSERMNSDSPAISVNATGEVQAPADIIQLQVAISLYNQSAREAFNRHKQQESFLTNLLIDEGIDDENIRVQPVSINPGRSSSNRDGYETRQQVLVQLTDIDQFQSMQLILIENGFDNFSGSFSSSEMVSAQEEAVKLAVEEAGKKAALIAGETGRELGEVLRIDYGSSMPAVYRSERLSMDMSSGGSLLQFEQTVPVMESVQIVYRLN